MSRLSRQCGILTISQPFKPPRPVTGIVLLLFTTVAPFCIPSLFCHIQFDAAWSRRVKFKTPWPESASELYRPSDCRLSARLVPTFSDRGCRVVRVIDPYGRILGFLDRSRYFSLQVAQLYSRGWVDPVPDPLILRKSGSAGNRTQTSRSVAKNSNH
jgi:hypothetical protein